MFENFTAKMSRIAAQSVKETISESVQPVVRYAKKFAPAMGLIAASAMRSKAARTTATVINYYFSGGRVK